MKKLTKIIAFIMAMLTLCVSFGCSGPRREDEESVDETKTQIWVSNFNAGIGDEWIYKVKARFEEEYKNFEGEDDKKGVQVMINNVRYSGVDLLNTIQGSEDDVFFTEFIYYYDMLAKNCALDVSDVIKEEDSNGKSIFSRFTDEQKAFYDYNGKYYGVPFYGINSGINYNRGLFEEKNLYFKADQNGNAYKQGGNYVFVSNANEQRSAGPDGKIETTIDNGLPATYEEFFALCDYMTLKEVTPFIWSGELAPEYMSLFLNALFADYEGREQLMLNFSFDGEAKNLIQTINNDGTIVKKQPTQIKADNGYEMYSTAGRYYALSFLDKMLSKSSYKDSRSVSETHSHTDAQIDFVLSNYEPGVQPVAMLIESTYWENEAKMAGAFGQLSAYGVLEDEVDFAYMPLPKATKEQVGSGITMLDSHYTMSFINAELEGSTREEIVKEFFKFCHSEESLREFTTTTNVPRALKYDLEQSDLAKMSKYAQSVWNVRSGADIVYPVSKNELYIANASTFNPGYSYRTEMNANAFSVLKERTMSVKDYFLLIKPYFEGIWGTLN